MPFAPLLAALLAAQVPEPPADVPLVWQAPPGCPDRAALERAIAGRLGRMPTPGELALVGQVARTPDGRYHLDLRVTVDGHTQTRGLTTRRCAALVDAAALLIALALDPSAAVADPAVPPELEPASDPAADAIEFDPPAVADPSPEPAPLVEAPPPVTPVDPPPAVELVEPLAPPPPPVRPRRPGGFVRLSGGLEYGTVPGPTAALDLAWGVLWRRARLEFHGVWLGPRDAVREPNAVRVSLLAAGAQGCARLGTARFEFPLCGGFELGGLRGQGRGPGAAAGTALWSAVRVSAGAAWHLHRRLSLTLTAQGLVRLAAARFDLSGPGPAVELWQPSPVSLRLLLGLEVRLGDRW